MGGGTFFIPSLHENVSTRDDFTRDDFTSDNLSVPGKWDGVYT